MAPLGDGIACRATVEQKAHFFALDLPHSDACFVRAYPAAVSEAWGDGHVHAFAFFGRVPQSVLYDNDRCLVAKILPGGMRKRAKLFSGFLSHYFIHDIYVGTRTVDVHIGRLRKALCADGGDDILRTIRGAGYALG